MIITIDGPTASGKSTVARALARHLNIYYINSGLLYRALAYLLIYKASYKENDLKQIKSEDIQTYLGKCHYSYDQKSGEHIVCDDVDITLSLKTSEMDAYSSIVSTKAQVREKVMQIDRAIAKKYDLVIDGRDTGSAVFPEADYKFFLTANVSIRAQRWQKEQAATGIIYTLEQATKLIQERDERDITRVLAPLCIPEGAIIIDNSVMDCEQTLRIMLASIEHKK